MVVDLPKMFTNVSPGHRSPVYGINRFIDSKAGWISR